MSAETRFITGNERAFREELDALISDGYHVVHFQTAFKKTHNRDYEGMEYSAILEKEPELKPVNRSGYIRD